MYYFTVTLLLVYAVLSNPTSCEPKSTSTMKFTQAEEESCNKYLEKTAEERCCKRKKFIAGVPKVGWFQAKANCEKIGFKLASISSKEDNKNAMKQLNLQGQEIVVAWIAANDLAREGNYSWSGNLRTPFSTYSNWRDGEPNDSNNDEDCAALWPDGSFSNYNCDTNIKYLCEYY